MLVFDLGGCKFLVPTKSMEQTCKKMISTFENVHIGGGDFVAFAGGNLEAIFYAK